MSAEQGRLWYVMGPSAAGKDSVLAYVRQQLPAAAGVVFAHRYITRAADAGGETGGDFAGGDQRTIKEAVWNQLEATITSS